MASVPNSTEQFDVNGKDHPVWLNAFDAATRQRLLEDDLSAGRNVSRILTSLVALGLGLAILTLFGLTM